MTSTAANLAALCRDNLHQLDRIDRLLGLLEPADYTGQQVAADPIGKHVRYTSATESLVTDIESTFERECHFVLSHTVHHMALIALLAQCRGYCVHEEFGVAGSTLRYRARRSECVSVGQ